MTSKCRHITSKCRLMTSFFHNLIPKFLLLTSAVLVNIFGGLFTLLTKEVFISAAFSFLFGQLQFFSSQIHVKDFSIAIICNQLVHIHHLMYSSPCECNACSFLFLWNHCTAITCCMIPLHCKLVLMSWSSDKMVKKMVDVFSWLWEIILEYYIIRVLYHYIRNYIT